MMLLVIYSNVNNNTKTDFKMTSNTSCRVSLRSSSCQRPIFRDKGVFVYFRLRNIEPILLHHVEILMCNKQITERKKPINMEVFDEQYRILNMEIKEYVFIWFRNRWN